MERNNLKLQRLPVWNQVHLGLFQIFLAVFERGGYQKVHNLQQQKSIKHALNICTYMF